MQSAALQLRPAHSVRRRRPARPIVKCDCHIPGAILLILASSRAWQWARQAGCEYVNPHAFEAMLRAERVLKI